MSPLVRQAAAFGLVSVHLLLCLSCRVEGSASPWRDQLNAESPCYEVNLLDGLDDQSTAELHALFQCLNYDGHLEPLAPVVERIDAPSPDARPVGLAVVAALDALPQVDVDPFALVGTLLDALRAEDRPIEPTLDVLLELIYAEPAVEVRAGRVSLSSPTALERGVVTTAAPLIPTLATAVRVDAPQTLPWLGDVVAHEDTPRWIRTLDTIITSPHPELTPHTTQVLKHLGEAVRNVQSPTNDRWSGATGHSLRDLLVAATLGPVPWIDLLSADIEAITTDRRVRSSLPNTLLELHEQGHLGELARAITWMASVDARGGSLQAGETSGLGAFLRLLHDANRPLSCSLDVWFTDVEINLGNIAVPILEFIAGQDEAFVADGSYVMSEILGLGLTETVLDQIASRGTCSVISPQLVDDLDALELLYQPQAQALLAFVTDILQVLSNGQQNHIPRTADLITDLVDVGAVAPTEELLRDVGTSPLIEDILSLLPVFLDPSRFDITLESGEPLMLDDLLDVVTWLVAHDTAQAGLGWRRVEPLVVAVVDQDALWDTLDKTANVLVNPRSTLPEGVTLVHRWLALDPSLEWIQPLATVLQTSSVIAPLLEVCETRDLIDALLTPRPLGSDVRPPQAFLAELIVDGTLESLLGLIDVLLNSLDSTTSDTTQAGIHLPQPGAPRYGQPLRALPASAHDNDP